ncbi:MAG: hypothetical protein ABR589_08340, partial [Chthoniobacterales bacterium]
MKRFRVFGFDLDRRALTLVDQQEHWDKAVKECHRQNRVQTLNSIISEFGQAASDQKLRNFIDLGPKPLSIFAFHNRFLLQARTAFVMDCYYPALTGACALGERILNHLILLLRDDYKATVEYKKVYNKNSFDNWNLAIDTLTAWNVLLPAVTGEFRKLRDRRNDAIHFRPEVDTNDRELALGAIQSLESIVSKQFNAFGPEPWFITAVRGEIYIKRDWEANPFVRKVYLPNCVAVGPNHIVESVLP